MATNRERIRRSDLWMIDFGSTPSDPEQGFHRPAIVVSDDRLHHPNLNMVVVVPGTSTIRSLPLHVVVEPDRQNGLRDATAFQTEQIRSVSSTRLLERLGSASVEAQFAIDDVLRSVLRL